MVAMLAIAVLAGGSGVAHAFLSKDGTTPYVIGPGDPYPDYLTSPNWANSPILRKFVDPLPGLCDPATTNCDLAVNIPLAVPDIVTYPGSDYYVIELHQYTQQMHKDLAPTTLRGYKQANPGTDTAGGCTDPALGQPNPCTAANNTVAAPTQAKYLGPLIIAQKDRPVRILFRNLLPTGAGGKLFVPVDETIMGAGPFSINYDPTTGKTTALNSGTFSQNRADLHLHGGRSPWISDGTPHQWITPTGEPTTYPRGVSVENVPDMPAPGPGEQTYYYTNQQSARLMFYHDHAWGITRLNVYAGEAAGYMIQDNTELALINSDVLPVEQIPMVIQDKTFVDTDPASPFYVYKTDPTWDWGMPPGTAHAGDLWWPHVYMPAQNPFDITGIAPMGRWAYGPYFWPATNNPFQPVPNPYYNPLCDVTNPAQNETNTAGYTTIPIPGGGSTPYCQPPEIPSTPNPSWGAEAFMDTPTVNGIAYPVLEVEPKAYRLRILNAAHDRFFNLSMFVADPLVNPNTPMADDPTTPNDEAALTTASAALCATLGGCSTATEVRMLPAINAVGMPATWPADGRVGGIPDWTKAGPEWTMIGTEGGFLPQPVTILPNPVSWNTDVTTFNAGNVNGGSLMLGPAERADVIVDFAAFAGQTLILYNDAPAPWPALDPHYDYFTGAPDMTEAGGAPPTLPGVGPNTRTIMQIKVVKPLTAETKNGLAYDPAKLTAVFDPAPASPTLSVFEQGQDPIIVGQSAYNTTYDTTFPGSWPNWGVSRINDKQLSFLTLNANGTVNPTPLTVGMKFKAIQDEQGETFDDYGRMRAGLGLELANAGAGQVNFIIQTFSDPSTEIVSPNEIQIWKITHNGVDTHPVHFHLFDVQIVNRVGWDGFIRLPDPTELGWKDTVRVSPLEDTIVAVRPATPLVPFGLPESKRPLNPATPLGSTVELSAIDPNTGQAWLTPNVNRILNFDWEYVWHCHILGHDENYMMLPVVFKFTEQLPGVPVLKSVTASGTSVKLTWTDPTPATSASTLGNPANEIKFVIERSTDGGATFTTAKGALANATAGRDNNPGSGRIYYRIKAVNAAGSTYSNTMRIDFVPNPGPAAPAPLLTVPLNANSTGRAAVTATASSTPGALYNYQYRLVGAPAWTNGKMNQTALSVTITLPAPGIYEFQVYVTATGFKASTPTAGSSSCTVSNVTVPPASLTVPATTASASVQTIAAPTPTPGTFNYRFQYSANAGATWKTYYDGPLLNPTATLPATGTYTFRARAYDPAVSPVYSPSAYRLGGNTTTW
ncbi:MAG: laccase [Desulfuromonas sp.]|nr:laccase [Desulfuromonas sp.]